MTRNLELSNLVIGPVARCGAVGVFPLFAREPLAAAEYALAQTVIDAGAFEIREASTGAAVGMLEARNHGRVRVLLVDGEHVIGAKQNRMLTSSVLVGARRKMSVPASCVERGRWRGPSEQFSAIATMAPAKLRRLASASVTHSVLAARGRAADQNRIWATIADQQQRLHVASATQALAHTYAERAGDLAQGRAELPYPAGAIGIAIAVGHEVISVDAFGRADTCAYYWPKLVDGALLEGLGVAGASLRVSAAEVDALLQDARASTWRPVEPVGDGDEQRAVLEAPGTASVLRLDGRLVHLGIVTSPGASALSSRPMRRELPPALARYQIVERIGVGGTKEVFRATDTQGGPDVAIARMPSVDAETFELEIAAVRAVKSHHVPQIFEAVVDDYGDGYLVMERCSGPNLATVVDGKPLPLAEAGPIMVALARGLTAIHAARVLHRDIKLENVMLSSDGAGALELKIVDFGLSARARFADTAIHPISHLGGTYPYMPNEVIAGKRLDARSDVYAFGVCCFRLLTGEFPLPPDEHENEFSYLQRLREVRQHDLSRLPPLPDGVRRLIARMLDSDRDARPYMPDVVAILERELGTPALRMPERLAPRAARTPTPALERVRRIETPLASAEHVLVAACMQAPLVTLSPGESTTEVRAFRGDGTLAWSRVLDGRLTAGVRADLDGDGMRELYLAGAGRLAVVGASGAIKLSRAVTTYAPRPSLIAFPSTTMPRVAIDGRTFDPRTGDDKGLVPHVYEGRGAELVDSADLRGMSYNGFAAQGFRGDRGTPAAIVFRPGERTFLVAQLAEHHATPRIQLAVYGAGGTRRSALVVAEGELATGDRAEIDRLIARSAPLFDARHAPIAVLDDRQAVVIVPLLGGDRAIPPTIAAFEVTSGRALWRTRLADTADARAILADVDGDGRPELVVGDGRHLTAFDPWTGAASTPIACRGLPVAFGDPFATGRGHLITVDAGGIELWRAGAWPCGTMQWSGPRADLWRTGTLRADGLPLGPM